MATQEALKRYLALVRKALSDGVLTTQEMQKLQGVGHKMGITPQEHQALMNKVKKEMMARHSSRGGPVMAHQQQKPSISSQARAAQIQTKKAAAGKVAPRPGAKRPPPKGGTKKKPPMMKRGPKKTGTGSKVTHAPTGAKKLDGMLGGGLPMKSNALVLGPPFIGKESFMYQFIMVGLKRGMPVVIITTDKTGSDVKNKLLKFDREFPLYDKKGLVRIVDCYSMTVGMKGSGTGTLYINGVQDVQTLLAEVNKLQKHIKEKFFAHRMVVLSLSKFLQTMGINGTMTFLNGLTSRNKVYNTSCLMEMASGIHPENEVMGIMNSLDGGFEFKMEDQQKYMRLIGLGAIENREWINFESTEQSFDIKAASGYSYIT